MLLPHPLLPEMAIRSPLGPFTRRDSSDRASERAPYRVRSGGHSTFRSCSLIFSRLSFTEMTAWSISIIMLLDPMVLISLPISWQTKSSRLALGTAGGQRLLQALQVAARALHLFVDVSPHELDRGFRQDPRLVHSVSEELAEALLQARLDAVLDLGTFASMRTTGRFDVRGALADVFLRLSAFRGPRGIEVREHLLQQRRDQRPERLGVLAADGLQHALEADQLGERRRIPSARGLRRSSRAAM